MDMSAFPEIRHEVDFCVVGGGMAGLAAAVAAARRGAKVALIHDRAVLGGNASSETRVHICGADRHNAIKNMRETGILEEIRLENLYRNPQRSWGVWDTVLYEKVRCEPNITPLLNCSCVAADMAGRRIASVTGWQLTTQTRQTVRARLFADCSGDAVLAPLTGAEFRVGREARGEYGEPAAPEAADRKTMGMSICFQTRRHDRPMPFSLPAWAYRFDSCDDLPYGRRAHQFWEMGYWWVELGGEHDSIADTESLKDELLRIAYGVWDHIKNRCPDRDAAANWALDWMQFLPAKRESRRYVGRHVLTQLDIQAEGRFDDLVAYGGWTMDDHPPVGFWGRKKGSKLPAAVHHPTPSPYGIPYRCLYSRNVENLMFAGRCHSATHLAMSSTRVMGTGMSMGQAIGTAAAMLAARGLSAPEELLPHVKDLQQALLCDDSYLPWTPQQFGDLTTQARLAASQGDPQPLRDGINRPVGDDPHAWACRPGDHVALLFDGLRHVEEVTLLLDSALHLDPQMSYHQPAERHLTVLPDVLPRQFRIETLSGGQWSVLHEPNDSHQRLLRLPVGRGVEGVRYTLLATWGPCERSNVYAFYVE